MGPPGFVFTMILVRIGSKNWKQTIVLDCGIGDGPPSSCRSGLSSFVDWGIGEGEADDAIEAAGVATTGLLLKAEEKTGEEDCWIGEQNQRVCPTTVFPTMDGPHAPEGDQDVSILCLHFPAFQLYPSMEVPPSWGCYPAMTYLFPFYIHLYHLPAKQKGADE